MRTLIFSALAATLCAAPVVAQTEAGKPLLLLMAQAEARPRAAEVEAQIERDLQALADAVNQSGDVTNASRQIYGARRGFFGASEWQRQLRRQLGRNKVQIDGVKIIERTDDDLKAAVAYSFAAPDTGDNSAIWKGARQEVLNFKPSPTSFRDARLKWRIVPPDAEPPAINTDAKSETEDVFWANVVYHLAQQKVPELVGTPAERSVSNLKVIGPSALRFALNTAETFAFDSRYLIDALLPYANSSANFFIPDTKEIYTFNANLSGKSMAALNEIAQTVLFYEGQDETPTFRYDGKAAICFADGHVALVSPDEAKNLIWKP